MKIFIAQNHYNEDPNGVNYKVRTEDEIKAEHDKIIALYPEALEIKDARNYNSELKKIIGHNPSTIYSLGADISAISNFGEDDLVIFSRDHYYDKFCNVLLQVCSFYNIPYKCLIYKEE